MIMRVRRLWPVIAIGMLLGFCTQLDSRPLSESATLLALGLVMVPYLTGSAVFPLNGVIWSIFFELSANLAHATALWRLSRPALLALAMSTALAMVAFASVMGTFDLGSWGGNFYFGFARVMLAYSIGCWLYFAARDKCLLAVPYWIPALALPGLFVGAWLIGATSWHFDILFVILACPLILVAGLADLGPLRRLGSLSGELSFPLYAVHVPVIYAVSHAGGHWLAVIPIALGLAWLVCILTAPGAMLSLSVPAKRARSEPLVQTAQ